MAHKVKCVYCTEIFDRDKIPCVPISNRYAHLSCHERAQANKSQDEKDYEALQDFIKDLFHMSILPPRVVKQIKDFRENYKFTYNGMLKTLIWWYNIKGQSIEEAHQGIGIIPFIYEDAKKYYQALAMIELTMQNQTYEHYQPIVKEYEIYPPQVWIAPPKLFNLDDEDEEI